MEDVPSLCPLGCTAHDSCRHHRHRADHDAFLATPDGEPKPADYPVQSPALVLPLARHQRAPNPLLDDNRHTVHSVPDRRSFPIICRGHLGFGIMFAVSMYTSFV